MDRILNNGFSEDQIKGVDVDAILKLYGQETQKPRTPDLTNNGTKAPKESTPDDLPYSTSTITASLSARGDKLLPIAIIGMSCRFPGGVSNVEEFQTLVSEGRSAWSKVPESRFNVDAFYNPDSDRTDSVRSRAWSDLATRNRSNRTL